MLSGTCPVEAPTPALVEGDDVAVLRDGVDDAGVPVVQGRGKVDEEHDGDAGLGPQLAVGVGGAAGGDGAVAAFAYEVMTEPFGVSVLLMMGVLLGGL